MSDSIDQTIVIDADTRGSDEIAAKISAIDKETKDSAKTASTLLKVITDLVKQLDGMDSTAAKQLRAELQELAKVINEMDVEKLTKLDDILQRIQQAKMQLPAESVTQLEGNLAKATKQAQTLQSAMAGVRSVKVTVEKGKNADDNISRQIGAMESADSLISAGERYLELLDQIPGRHEEEKKAIQSVIDLAAKAGPENVDAIRKAMGEIQRGFFKMKDSAQMSAASIQQEFDNFGKELTDNIQPRLQELDNSLSETFSGKSFTTAILNGNFNSMGQQLLSLVKKTRSWSAAMVEGGAKAGSWAAAFSVAAYGISKAIDGLTRMWDNYRESVNAVLNTQRQLFLEQGQQQTNYFTEEKGRAESRIAHKAELRDSALNRDRDIARAGNSMALMQLEMERSARLRGTTDDEGRYQIEREYNRKQNTQETKAAYQEIDWERQDIDNRIADLTEGIEANEKLKKKMMAFEDTFSEDIAKAEARLNKLGTGDLSGAMEQLMHNMAALAGTFREDGAQFAGEWADSIKGMVEGGKTVQEAIRTAYADFVKSIEDSKRELVKENDRRAVLSRQQDEVGKRASKFAEEEAAADRQHLLEREALQKERNRAERLRLRDIAEEEESVADSREEPLMLFGDLKAKWEKRQRERAAEERAAQEKYDKWMDEHAGLDETQISQYDKTERQNLLEDLTHARSRRMAADSQVHTLNRSGDVEAYRRQREFELEEYDVGEAERAQRRRLASTAMGEMGNLGMAKSELSYRQDELAADRKLGKDLAGSVKSRLVREGRVDANESVNLKDEKYYRMMTDEERARYDAIRADLRRDRSNVRNAQGEVDTQQMEMGKNMAGKAEAFNQKFNTGNRLVSMGLAGGEGYKWDENTARNTEKMVTLMQKLIDKEVGKPTMPVAAVGF